MERDLMGKRKCMVTMDDTRITELEEQLKTVADRPYWQDRPCPPWCSGHHLDDDHPDDRRHYSHWEGEVVLSLAEPHIHYRANPDGTHDSVVDPAELQVYVLQGVRENAPRVQLSTFVVDHRGLEIDMTVKEARKLRAHLDTAIALAESA